LFRKNDILVESLIKKNKMSITVINNILIRLCNKLNVSLNTPILKKIILEEDYGYKIELLIHDQLYSVHHYEPWNAIKNVNYGHGPYYHFYIFDNEKECFVDL